MNNLKRKFKNNPTYNSNNKKNKSFKNKFIGTSLVVQRLRLCAPNAGDPGLIPGQGVRSRMLQLKIPHATTKTRRSQINK